VGVVYYVVFMLGQLYQLVVNCWQSVTVG